MLGQRVAERLPRVELAELRIEVEQWTQVSRSFTHAGGSSIRLTDFAVQLYAAILAQACNLGLTSMAEVAELTYCQLAWTTEWRLREETRGAAVAAVVHYQHRLPLAQHWGGGPLSSSDGQRFPVAVQSPGATALPRYFGRGRGGAAYPHVSDQHTTFATTVIPATIRDAPYVLDGILHNETERPIVERTTDTAGYTDLVFALVDLLGLQVAPRLRDRGDQRVYRLGPAEEGKASALLKGSINQHRIVQPWDELLFAELGTRRRSQQEDQANQASCLTLVTTAVVTWNTVYLAAVLEQLRSEGQALSEEALRHLSPALYDHINPYGTYQFDLEAAAQRQGLRPLRRPDGG